MVISAFTVEVIEIAISAANRATFDDILLNTDNDRSAD